MFSLSLVSQAGKTTNTEVVLFMAEETATTSILTQNSQRTVMIIDVNEVFCAHPELFYVLEWLDKCCDHTGLFSFKCPVYIWHVCVIFLLLFTTRTLCVSNSLEFLYALAACHPSVLRTSVHSSLLVLLINPNAIMYLFFFFFFAIYYIVKLQTECEEMTVLMCCCRHMYWSYANQLAPVRRGLQLLC